MIPALDDDEDDDGEDGKGLEGRINTSFLIIFMLRIEVESTRRTCERESAANFR